MDEHWTGRGYGTEALRLFSGHLFQALDVDRTGLMVDPDNSRAIRCYEKAGYGAAQLFGEQHVLLMVLRKPDARHGESRSA